MTDKRITCPETAHGEVVVVDETPLGTVISECSRFGPGCAVTCSRACARALDQVAWRFFADHTERVLIVNAGAPELATMLQQELQSDGLTVELADASARTAPPPEDYDSIVIVARERLSHVARRAIAYMTVHAGAIAAMPAFVVLVGGRNEAPAVLPCSVTHMYRIGSPHLRARLFNTDRGRSSRARSVREIALAIGEAIPACEVHPPR